MSAYSASRVRRGLLHFGVGKLGSGLLGIVLMLVLVRLMPAPDYAAAVSLLAAFELLTLVLNMGALSATFRFLPQVQSAGTAADVALLTWITSVWRAVPLLMAGLVIVVKPALLLMLIPLPPASDDTLAGAFALILVLESMCRHCDLVMELLLLQRVSQLLIAARTAGRLLGLLLLSAAARGEVNVTAWIWLEVAVSGAGLAAGLVALLVLVQGPARGVKTGGQIPDLRRALRYALPGFAAQVLAGFQGIDACKLVVAQVAPPQVMAAFGFAASLVATLQRYLPSYLLLGFLRPLFVHASLSDTKNTAAINLAAVLLKVNMAVLLPMLVIATLCGDALITVLSGGKVHDGRWILVAMLLLVSAQALQMILSLLALSVEDNVTVLIGTTVGAVFFASGLAMMSQPRPVVLLLLAVGCEALRSWVAQTRLRGRGCALRWRDSGYLRLLAASLASVGAGGLMVQWPGIPGNHVLLAAVVASVVLSFAALTVIMKPLHPDERALLAKILPLRLIVF